MNRYQRAIAHADMDALSRSRWGVSAAQEFGVKQVYLRLAEGWPARDIERMRAAYWPAIPSPLWQKLEAYVKSGAGARERQERFLDCVLGNINPLTGIPVAPLPASLQEQVRHECEALAVQEYAEPLTGQMSEHDAHRDRVKGIDQQSRVEQARKAALQNPANVRHNDVERAWSQHDPQPTLYAHQRREGLAQFKDNLVERMRATAVRDADKHRDPARSDDRSDDIRLAYDVVVSDEMARDELALAANPTLERIDDAITHAGSMGER